MKQQDRQVSDQGNQDAKDADTYYRAVVHTLPRGGSRLGSLAMFAAIRRASSDLTDAIGIRQW
jgi:hypothetical protein